MEVGFKNENKQLKKLFDELAKHTGTVCEWGSPRRW